MLFPTELCACIGHISYFRDREPRTSTSTFTVLRPQRSWTIRDGEPRTATSTFTQIYVHGDHGLLGTGRPGHPPQLSHRFTSTEIMDYWGRGAQDIHLNFHTDLRPRRSWTIGDGEPRTSTTTFIHPLSSNVNRFLAAQEYVLLKRRETFLLQGQLSVPTYFGTVSVALPCYLSST